MLNQPKMKPEQSYPIELETFFVASLINQPDLIDQAIISVDSPKYFYDRQAKHDYQILLDMHEQQEPISAFSFSSKPGTLKASEYVISYTDAQLKTEFGNTGMNESNIHQWCDAIVKAYTNRLAQELIANNLEINDFISQIENIRMGNAYVLSADEQIKLVLENPEQINPVFKYPFHKIQSATNGIYKSHMIVVAARTGTGKTIFLQNVAYHISQNAPILFVSTEMTSNDMMLRVLSAISLVNLRFTPEPTKIPEFHAAIDDYSKHQIDFIYSADMRTILKAISLKKYQMVFIDYLQMITPMGKFDNSFDKVAQTVLQIKKHICMKYEIPVMVAAQFNREGVKAGEKPELHQLKDSGVIEQTADYVISIYQTEDDHKKDKFNNETLHFEILKARHGQALRNTKNEDNYIYIDKPHYRLIDSAF